MSWPHFAPTILPYHTPLITRFCSCRHRLGIIITRSIAPSPVQFVEILVENGTNRNADPTFLFHFYTHHRHIVHRLAKKHARDRQQTGRQKYVPITIAIAKYGQTFYKISTMNRSLQHYVYAQSKTGKLPDSGVGNKDFHKLNNDHLGFSVG